MVNSTLQHCSTLFTATHSRKGFIAIDMDGTALVQKIDKFTKHGLQNAQANFRESLLAYTQAAQQQGYDIYILTARPELIESLLYLPIGTKPTTAIQQLYEDEGIKIKGIKRAQHKGSSMVRLLAQYPPTANGFLIDDQLSQIENVNQHKSSHNLHGIDINNYDDLNLLLDITSAQLNGFQQVFQPQEIICSLLDADNDRQLTPVVKALRALSEALKHHQTLTAKEKLYYEKIIRDLCLKTFETEFVSYQPDLDWLLLTANELRSLLNKHDHLQLDNLQQATNHLFSVSSINQIKPNTRCEQNIHFLFAKLSARAAVNELQQLCHDHQQLLQIKTVTPHRAQKISCISELAHMLNQDLSANVCLEQFMLHLDRNKALLLNSEDTDFWAAIRQILAQLPLIGYLFMNDEESLLNSFRKINDAVNTPLQLERAAEKNELCHTPVAQL